MNNLQNISVIIARHREDYFSRCIQHLQMLGVEDVVAIRNADSIFTAYDHGIANAKHETLLFLHEDAEITSIEEAYVHQLLASDSTGLLGVAGTRYLNSDAIWWHGENGKEPRPKSLSGACGHFDENGKKFKNFFGPYGHVVALDGVCLFARKSTILNLGGFKDDVLTGFDFYDLSISVRASLAGLCNYTIPMEITHWGNGNTRESWEQNRQNFITKYKESLPLSI